MHVFAFTKVTCVFLRVCYDFIFTSVKSELQTCSPNLSFYVNMVRYNFSQNDFSVYVVKSSEYIFISSGWQSQKNFAYIEYISHLLMFSWCVYGFVFSIRALIILELICQYGINFISFLMDIQFFKTIL